MRKASIASFIGLSVVCACVRMGPVTRYSIQVEHKNDMYYELRIVRDSDRAIAQTIPIRNGEDLTQAGRVELVDMNGDGHPDLRVLGGYVDKNPWHKIWLFDTKTETFVWSHTTERRPGG